jgi:hypothetical protein
VALVPQERPPHPELPWPVPTVARDKGRRFCSLARDQSPLSDVIRERREGHGVTVWAILTS